MIAMQRRLCAVLVLWALFAVAPSYVLAEGKVKVGDTQGGANQAFRQQRINLEGGKPTSALQRWKKARGRRGQQVTTVPELDPGEFGQTLLLLAGAGWLALGQTRRRTTT
jgi:hypothetical protein